MAGRGGGWQPKMEAEKEPKIDGCLVVVGRKRVGGLWKDRALHLHADGPAPMHGRALVRACIA
jgi:hypothetical protein